MSWDALEVAATDRSSGSAAVAERAAEAFVEIASTLPEEAILAAARTLVRGQPVMAACLRLADRVVSGLDESGPPGARRAASVFAQRLGAERLALVDRIRERLPEEGVVLTVSASSTVVEALVSSGASRIRVRCAASEPGGEGRAAAERLLAEGIDAAVIPDGAVAQHASRCDAVVFGADALGPASVMNKTGTLAAVLGARTSGRPCLCAAGSSKIVGDDAWPAIAAAAGRLYLEGVPVFEEVPSELVTTVLTDKGALSARAMRRTKVGLHPRIVGWLL